MEMEPSGAAWPGDRIVAGGGAQKALMSGAVKIEVGQTFPLAQARAAHEALEGRRTTGATLLIP